MKNFNEWQGEKYMKLFKIASTNKYNSPEIIPILGDLNNILNTLAFPCKHIHIWMCFWVLLYLQGNFAEGGTQFRHSSWRSAHLPRLRDIGAQRFLTADVKRSDPGILLQDFFLPALCIAPSTRINTDILLLFLFILTHTFWHFSPLSSEATSLLA